MKKIPKIGYNRYDFKENFNISHFFVLLFNFVKNISMCTLETF
jgi:hypothetical protein